MSYIILDSFDTIIEAEEYLELKVSEGIDRERLIIFDDSMLPELGKRFSVNMD